MGTCVVLIRGINVGGKNPVSMAELRTCLEELGCTAVSTLLASGNAIVDTSRPTAELATAIEQELPQRFRLPSELVRVLVVPAAAFRRIIDKRPKGFGDQPELFHSDAIFLIDVDVSVAMSVFDPREGVDTVWAGDGVIYSQRLSALRTKSRLGKIVGTVPYKSMTIRSWQTTLKLRAALDARSSSNRA
ncbi:DUF1697 domain-containing protein [soil metagenome]